MTELRATGLHPGHGDVDIEVALAEERARTLGKAGASLDAAVQTYRAAVRDGRSASEVEQRLTSVVHWLYRLRLQRECSGARTDNLGAIQRAYDVPDEAVRRL